MVLNKKIPVSNLIVNESALKNFHMREADQITNPFIMILGGRDQVVNNKASRDFFEISSSKVQDKDIVTYDDADHFMVMDNEFSPLIAKDLIGWFNTHI
jgi:esterase/lipase